MPVPRKLPARVAIATNNGDIGGGEVMLLSIARALVELGVQTTVVGPSSPSGLVDEARARGFETVELPADGRREWMLALRRWDARDRDGILWCNGLVPSFATAGHTNRVVHLHQRPQSRAQQAIAPIARRGALTTLVPSYDMASSISSTRVLENWVPPIEEGRRLPSVSDDRFTVGFLGRTSSDKGIGVLAQAMRELESAHPGRFELLIGGAPRFVDDRDRDRVEAALSGIAGITRRPGWVAPRDFFASVDLFVVPSVWREPFGLVAAEAMSARVPVVVSDAGALAEVVGNDAASVVPAGDAGALADVILKRSREAGDSFANTSRVSALHERWRSHYSPDAGRERVARLLGDLGVELD